MFNIVQPDVTKNASCHLQSLYQHFPHLAQVTRTQWWMGHYHAPTPKRHFAYSNSPVIGNLDRGVLSGWKKREQKKVKTAITYMNKQGKKCYKGTPELRSTENIDKKRCCKKAIHGG